jgi:hypothetical protein
MLEVLLFASVVLLFLVYRELVKKNNIQNVSERVGEVDMDTNSWLKNINRNIHELLKLTASISDFHSSDNPAGKNSYKYKRMNSLIKLYSNYLVKSDKLTLNDALTRAKFEYHEFGDDTLIEKLDDDWINGLYSQEKISAEKKYYSSGILENEIMKKYKADLIRPDKSSLPSHLAPYYLAEPIYAILVKEGYNNNEKKEIRLSWGIENENGSYGYYNFVKNRAILFYLEQLGIIKRTNKERGEKQMWMIPDTNWSRIKNKIYGGQTEHEDNYFEERYKDGDLNRLFSISYY